MSDKKPLILIVEDEEALREVLSRILATRGYRCEQAVYGQVGF